MIAITGSAGKTTTKNLVAAALATMGEVHSTVGNQNNKLGTDHSFWVNEQPSVRVIEMGATGDITSSSRDPTWRCV